MKVGKGSAVPAEEVGVLVDEGDRVVGTASRRDIRRKNLLHRGVAIIVRNPSGEIYVHRRTATKDVFPRMYDMVVGGMVTAGETYEETARRELAEELGVVGVEPAFLLKHRYRGDENNAWMSLFEVVWSGAIRHQEEEISWGAYMTHGEIVRKLDDWPFAPDHLEVFELYRRVSSGPGGQHEKVSQKGGVIMADARLNALGTIPLFAEVPKRHLRTILKRMGEYEYEDGATIVKDGSRGEVMFVLLDGTARVVRGGRTAARLGPGDFFGEIAVLDRRPRTARVIAASPVRCLTLHRDDLREVIASEPEVAWSLLQGLASRIRGD
jgi:isopentenyldiphosphate isomerase